MSKKLNTEFFIEQSSKIHNNKYDYSLVEYVNNKTKVKIICPDHGIFEQRPDGHLNGFGCKKCTLVLRSNKDVFIDIASNLHKNKYDYSLVEYVNSTTKIKIICPEHGIFEQTPNNHRKGIGCPMCNISKGENKIKEFLTKNNIKFHWHHSFDNCRNKKPLEFDFYLYELNTCIEYDGIQHYNPIDFFGGKNGLKYIQKNDRIKTKYCENNGINLIRFKYNEKINFDKIII